MTNTRDTAERQVPITDRQTVEQMYRGVCQEIEGLAEQMKGKQQIKSALKKHMEREQE